MSSKLKYSLLFLWIVSPMLLFGLALRHKYFPSTDPEDWAHAGDWLSGASTLTIGIIGTYLIYITIRQNSKALEDSARIIEHSQNLQSLVTAQLGEMVQLQSKVAQSFIAASSSLDQAIARLEEVAVGLKSQLEAAAGAARVKEVGDAIGNLDASLDALLHREIPIHGRYGGALQQVKAVEVAKLLEIQWDKQTSQGLLEEIKNQHPQTYSEIVKALRRRIELVTELEGLAPALAETFGTMRVTEEGIFL